MNRPFLPIVLASAVFVAFGAACSSDPATSDAGTTDGGTSPATDSSAPVADASKPTTDSSTPVADAGLAPTFSNVYTTVVEGTCTTCHTTGHSTGLDMSSKATAYTNLVGKASGAGGTSSSCQGKTRVTASDAKASLFWSKIDHSAGCGNNMPLAGSKLSSAKIKLVEDWIAAGAKND